MDSIVHGILQARILEWVAFPFSRGSSQLRNRNQVSLIAGDSLPAEPPRKLKNTGVGSLSLLWEIFLTQELNWGLLHCRQILYQLRAWQPTPVFLPGESPWTEEHGGLQSTALQRVRHTWMTKHRTAQRKKQWKQKLVLWKDQQKWKVYLDWPR